MDVRVSAQTRICTRQVTLYWNVLTEYEHFHLQDMSGYFGGVYFIGALQIRRGVLQCFIPFSIRFKKGGGETLRTEGNEILCITAQGNDMWVEITNRYQ